MLRSAHTVDDAPVGADKDEVRAAPDKLKHKLLARGKAQLVMRVDLQLQHTLMLRLAYRNDPRAGQMLAQEHTEHRRLGGVFYALRREMQPRIPRARRDEQAAHREQDGVPLRLLHLVDTRAL